MGLLEISEVLPMDEIIVGIVGKINPNVWLNSGKLVPKLCSIELSF